MVQNLRLKTIFKGLASYGAAEGVAKGLNIISILMMSYFLEVGVFGKVSLLLMFELLFLEMVVVGQHHSVLRYGANKNLYKIILLGLGISAVSFTLWALLIAIFVDSIISIPKSLLLLLLFAAFLQGYIQIILANYRVSGLINFYAIIRIGFQLLKLSILYILISFERNLSFYPESLIASGILTILVIAALSLVHRSTRSNNIKNDPSLALNLKVGFPLGLHAVIGVTYTFVDRIMIGRLLDFESLGIYQLASTLGLSAFFFVNVVALFFTPQIYSNSNNLSNAKKLLNSFSIISSVGIVFISIFVYILAVNFIHFFDESYKNIIPLLPLFFLVLMVQTLNLYGLYGLTMLEKVKFVPLITISALLLHLLLSKILITWMDIKGAILSLIISELVYATSLFYLFSKEYKRKIKNVS